MGSLDFRLLGGVVDVIPGLSRHFSRLRGALGGSRVKRIGWLWEASLGSS